jgi:hypothetical protein
MKNWLMGASATRRENGTASFDAAAVQPSIAPALPPDKLQMLQIPHADVESKL